MSEEGVRWALGGSPDEYPGVWYYFDSCLQINFEEGKVNYIELSWCDDQFDVQYKGVSVFHTAADELVAVISGDAPASETNTFTSHELDLGLWRPVVPSEYSSTDPDDEYRNGKYWQTIGVGNGDVFRGRE